MDDRPIGFFDSGVGGLPYYAFARGRLPLESFVYLADTRNFPYGEKASDEVRSHVLEGIELLCRIAKPKMIVIACNTASVVALAELRSTFKLPFVGVVPAVKPAAERSAFKRIALLATGRTVGETYVDELIESFASDCEVIRIPDGGLVRFVEHELIEGDENRVREALRPIVETVRRNGVDSLVLGCTHFTLLEEALRNELGESVAIVDSREGVCRQVERLIKEGGIAAGVKRQDSFYLTGNSSDGYRRFAARFGLSYGGEIR